MRRPGPLPESARPGPFPPSPLPRHRPTSSAWIGVDGFNNSNLIQTGTEEDYYSGAAHYNAWWEILPASETALAEVGPGRRRGPNDGVAIYEDVEHRLHR